MSVIRPVKKTGEAGRGGRCEDEYESFEREKGRGWYGVGADDVESVDAERDEAERTEANGLRSDRSEDVDAIDMLYGGICVS